MIVVDSPKTSHYGGAVAAPAFEQIGAWYANHAGSRPTVRFTNLTYDPGGCSSRR